MIKQRDVITIRLPFPNLNSALAVRSHMYICENEKQNDFCFIKCQTYKNKNYNLNHYLIEDVDISRNPFNKVSLIDCEKRFNVRNVSISEDILAKKRRNVSEELFKLIKQTINEEECDNKEMDRKDVCTINKKIELL